MRSLATPVAVATTVDLAETNVISGNDWGVQIEGEGTMENRVSGNIIGLTADGKANLGNTYGVVISKGAQSNFVGVKVSDKGYGNNVIAGNSPRGIWLSGSGTEANRVAGNFIGQTFFGAAVGNFIGISIEDGASGNFIGFSETPSLVEPNLIAHNGTGVQVKDAASLRNSIRGNSISENAGMGIDLVSSPAGVTENDIPQKDADEELAG